ncbi:hypothetical protein ACTMTJ_45050 [Phytohabitans sp. LJ34]|uniref:hypothetical protein n=1 Tax=Phytohabitans sp. LJ34 TaxID=3452217 RepID=UPI003F88BEA7
MRGVAAFLLALLVATSVHGAGSTAAPAGAMAHGPASIGAAVVHTAPASVTHDQRLDPAPVPRNDLPPRAEGGPAVAAEPDATRPAVVTSAPRSSRAPPHLH